MSNPSIELARSTGWTNSLWQEAMPILDEAAGLATEGVEYLDLSYGLPKVGKVLRFRQAGLTPYEGLAYDETRFDIRVVLEAHKVWHGAQLLSQWSSVIVHEAIHCVRFENGYNLNHSPHEPMANEALAYVGEYIYADEYCTHGVRSLLSADDLRPNRKLEARFREVARLPPESVAARSWSYERSVHSSLSDSNLYGAQRLYAQLQAGHELLDLMPRPAEEVLGL